MIAVFALDGLDPDTLAAVQEGGRLPALSALGEAGVRGRLRSAFPPVSVPAWSTFLSGVEPGRHGLFDFTRLERGRVRFQSGDDRAVPTLLELLDVAGRRAACLGVPTTWPAPRLAHGVVLSGFDSPFAGRPDARATHPTAYWRALRREGIELAPALVAEGRKGPGWHARAASVIARAIELRTALALRVLRDGPWDLFVVHYQAADTAGHHFSRYFDPRSERHCPDDALGRVIPEVYAGLDRAVARLSQALPRDALRVVVSDHGMGPASRRVVHLNRWLEENGFLVRRSAPAAQPAALLRSAALRLLPRGLQARLFRLLAGRAAALESAVRLGEIDFARSAAFSEESSTLPGIWILEPRRGDEVLRALRGFASVRRVHRREDVYRGPERGRAPDLLLELHDGLARTPSGYRGPSLRVLADGELDGERGAAMNGEHRPEGVLLAAGPGVAAGTELHGAWLGDLAPTLLCSLGVAIPSWMDGRPLAGFPGVARWTEDVPAARPGGVSAYSPAQEAQLAARLQALGYLG
jgi:predicted AlkP superfamily phosphohydrolase/phosphomutase